MIAYIDEVAPEHKKILMRVDYNLSLHPDHSISDDLRIRQTLDTLHYLLKLQNKVILIAHLGNPVEKSEEFSLKSVAERLQRMLPDNEIILISDFLTEPRETFENQESHQILLLENIRFHKGEKDNDLQFAKELANLADIYVNDAFGASHRTDASITLVPTLLPSYGGLLLKKEVHLISQMLANPEKPFVAIVGGAKISTKLKVLTKFSQITNTVLVGGAIANTLLATHGKKIGKSLYDEKELELAKQITNVQLPTDVVTESGENKKIEEIQDSDVIIDIGAETQQQYAKIIAGANTIIWNGPMGMFEKENGKAGTAAVYNAVVSNENATSIVGGGETITSLSKEEHSEKITHISTGGGALLEFIEKGTLPGIEALNR